MGSDYEASTSWSGAGFLGNSKQEEDGSSFLVNSGEEEVDSNKNDSCWDNAGSGDEENELWEPKLRSSLPWWFWFVSIS